MPRTKNNSTWALFKYGIPFSSPLLFNIPQRNYTVGQPPLSMAQKCLIVAGMIHEGDIDLDPEYQRGVFFNTLHRASC
jgi:hypothetical protein